MLPVRCLSKKITSSGVVTAAGKAGLCFGLTLIGGTTASKALLEDGGSGGADTYALTTNAGTNIGDEVATETFPTPIHFSTDIYCTLSGTGAYAYVLYTQMKR